MEYRRWSAVAGLALLTGVGFAVAAGWWHAILVLAALAGAFFVLEAVW